MSLSKFFAKQKRGAKTKYCCICRQAVRQFHPYRGGWQAAPPLMFALAMTGSDLDNFSCPECAAHDRERHLYLYLERLGILETIKTAQILHFAPEGRLTRLIEKLGPTRYVRADLFPNDATIEKIDMLDVPYSANTFDIVIANHVLEHVMNDLQALSELHRVLKPNGLAILQTPFSAKLEATFQDPGVDSDVARLHLYGQEDHVRLYGKDIFRRFASSGLIAEIHTHAEVLADIDFMKYGVNPQEPLFLFKKPHTSH